MYYSAITNDEELLNNSSSGGMFGVLAKYITARGGAVCGCILNNQLEAVHILSEDYNEIEKMYGSKYVQSNIINCYESIKNRLQKGQVVLFTGTACQVAAVKSYLGHEYDNLFTVDVLCHGVPSPALFKKFIEYHSNRTKKGIVDIKFRDKSKNGWGSEHRTSITYNDGSKKWLFMPAYFSAFFYGLSLRESCYRCPFAGQNRIADITIGDYWGAWEKYKKRFTEGISVVLVNSKKGEMLFRGVQGDLSLYDLLTMKEAFRSNDNLYHPVIRPPERESFYQNTDKYNGLWKKVYTTKTYRKKTITSFYGAIIPQNIRLMLHKIGD
jgi:coenzyme F420-reducing hydrogenase beta subunit